MYGRNVFALRVLIKFVNDHGSNIVPIINQTQHSDIMAE